MLKIILIFRVKILVVEVVEEFHKGLKHNCLILFIVIADYNLKGVGGKLFQKIMNFITNFDDFLVQRVTSRKMGVFYSDVFNEFEYGIYWSMILCTVAYEVKHEVVPIVGKEDIS